MKSAAHNNGVIFFIAGMMISGLVVGIASAADKTLILEKTVHFTDECLVNEEAHISFPVTDSQYDSYETLKIDYHNLNPQTSLALYMTTDKLYELSKQGHGITYQGLGSQLFGDGTLYFELSDFKELSGYNHLNLYGMVRPFGAESDVTFSITLTDEIVRATTIITTIPPPTSRTTLVTQTTTIPPSYTTYTPPPTDTPASPLHIECAIMALVIGGLILRIRH